MIKNSSCVHLLWLLLFIAGCRNSNLADVTIDLPENNWVYAEKVKASVTIPGSAKSYNIYFRLRVTSAYRYSNIYILLKRKDPSGKINTTRFGYKLAEADGQWRGKGSGNLYAYKLPMLTNYRFAGSGKFEFSIEQNMRDNPLRGISDAGMVIEEVP